MKTSLYNQDGSLHPEAQFLLSFKSNNMSMGDWKKRMKAFKASLSSEDLEEFERLKIKHAGAEQRAKKPKVIEQIEIRKIDLYDEDGCLLPEARKMISHRPDGVTAPRWNKMLTAFMRCLSEEEVVTFLKLRVADSHKRRRLKILKTIPDWFDKNYTKINLYDEDGSLCKEAQFLITFRIDILPTEEDREIARLRLNHFKDRLSKKDLETFAEIRSREMNNLKQARYRRNNIEKVRATNRKRNRVYMPKWNAANPEKSKARADRYVAKQAKKHLQERLEKYPEYYAGWFEEETINLYKEDGTLFCDSIGLLIKANPENLPKCDWVRILKDFRSKLSVEDIKTFNKLRRTDMFSRNKKFERERSPIVFKLRKAVENAFNRIKKNKPARTLELLGCTWEEARLHIESLFQEGMTWENHGRGNDKWHLDHIRPVCSFEDHELHLMNRISNLRPLWQKDNFTKRTFDRKQSVRNKTKEASKIN
jgi:hypothetical protein